MALALIRCGIKVNKVHAFVGKCLVANMSTGSIKERDIEKSVFISQSYDIFSNLALEDWMYKKWDFSKHHVMLLWRNDPCVVVGRHQNPWVEADGGVLEEKNIALARRNSGGGAVYHDKGNLNVTFFTPRDHYNRKNNLELIAETLRSNWSLDIQINERHDIILDSKYKVSQVSGTASKLGRPNAYHHCTLLVDVDKTALSSALHHNQDKKVLTNATKSVRSETVNLEERGKGLNMEGLMTALGWAYLATCPETQKNGGWAQVSTTRGFQLVSPTEDWFPGLGETKEELSSWDWIYGKTPKFEVKRQVGNGLVVGVMIENGNVGEVSVEGIEEMAIKMVTSLGGQRFTPQLLDALVAQVTNQAPALLRHSRAEAHAAA